MQIPLVSNFSKSVISVKVMSAKETLFEGQASAVSSENDTGPFDILQNHSRFISVIHKKVIVHITPQEVKEFPIQNGVLTVENNVVKIYVGL